MILVTDLHGHSVYVNAELIEVIEENPETQVLLTTGKRLYVKENAKMLAERVLQYKRHCMERPELHLKDQNAVN